jgi:hypothetical protein
MDRSIDEIPLIFGIGMTNGKIGITALPNGTTKENCLYYEYYRPKGFISIHRYSMKSDAYDFLFERSKALEEVGIHLDDDAIAERARRVLYA